MHEFVIRKTETDCNEKLGTVWFHGTFLVKLNGCSVRNFKSSK